MQAYLQAFSLSSTVFPDIIILAPILSTDFFFNAGEFYGITTYAVNPNYLAI